MPSEQDIAARIDALAHNLRQKGLAWSDSQARERAKDIVMQEIRSQEAFEKMKDDAEQNPQQRAPSRPHMHPDVLKNSGGMLTGDELPKDMPLSELLKGRARQEKK